MWQKQHSVTVVTLQCVGLARLNYISQKSLSCMFLIKVSPERDSPVRFEGWKWSSSHFGAHTHCRLSSLSALVWSSSQACNCSACPSLSAPPNPGPEVCLATWLMVPASFYKTPSPSRWQNWHRFQFLLMLLHPACFALSNLPPISSSWPPAQHQIWGR